MLCLCYVYSWNSSKTPVRIVQNRANLHMPSPRSFPNHPTYNPFHDAFFLYIELPASQTFFSFEPSGSRLSPLMPDIISASKSGCISSFSRWMIWVSSLSWESVCSRPSLGSSSYSSCTRVSLPQKRFHSRMHRDFPRLRNKTQRHTYFFCFKHATCHLIALDRLGQYALF